MTTRQLSEANSENLRSLEKSLWQHETRSDLALQKKIFAPDFFEFGMVKNVELSTERFLEILMLLSEEHKQMQIEDVHSDCPDYGPRKYL